MSEPTPPRPRLDQLPAQETTKTTETAKTTAASGRAPTNDDKMICERCGQAEMYRMHAVWRCPSCGFKTDCCGW